MAIVKVNNGHGLVFQYFRQCKIRSNSLLDLTTNVSFIYKHMLILTDKSVVLCETLLSTCSYAPVSHKWIYFNFEFSQMLMKNHSH